MSYMLLIMEQAERRKNRAPEQKLAELDAMLKFQQSLKTPTEPEDARNSSGQ